MKYITVLLFLFLTFWVYSQSPEYQISIVANTSVSGHKFKIDLQRGHDELKIVLYQRDSTSKLEPGDRATLDSIREDILKRNEIPTGVVEWMESLNEKYEHYSTDTLFLSYPHEVIERADAVYRATEDELKMNLWTGSTDFFVGIDGTRVRVEIKDKESYRRVGVWSPRKDTYPLIYYLMNSVLEYNRVQNPKILKTKKETSGY